MSRSFVRAEQIFAEALDLPPGEGRVRLVAEHCGGDLALREEVESLLRAHDEAGGFLDLGMEGGGEGGGGRECAERIHGPLGGLEEEPPCLPGFRIERRIGRGSLGVVYAAYDEKLHRRVAIKVLMRRGDLEVNRRLMKEARHAAALGDPALVTIFCILDEVDPPALVMELVEGFPLDRFAARLSFRQKAELVREVARGLSVAHAHGLVHRDLKPDNVLVGPEMRPRILDFGLALTREEAGRLAGGFEGTPLYASPEQALGKPLSPASDVFSFGSLMFKVFTGREPFGGGSLSEVLEAIAGTSPPFLREVSVGVPEDLQAVCLACLAWSPEDRPSAEQITLELGRFLAGEPVRVRPKLYEDILRRSVSEHASQIRVWESQGILSRDECDSLESVHRRLLADEDDWIVDARRISPLQALLSLATWLTVVASGLSVWMLREEIPKPWRWGFPVFWVVALLLAGHWARRWREHGIAATFLSGAALAIAPATLALLREFDVFAGGPAGVVQLFPQTFANEQVFAASLTALGVSSFALWRLQMTGLAWTTAALGAATYLSGLLPFNWLDQKPEVMALWCLPLGAFEFGALWLEKLGRVRWTKPFHWIGFAAIVVGLDVVAVCGPTLEMLGTPENLWGYFDQERQVAFSIAVNGGAFLGLMFVSQRAPSLDLRRSSQWLEVLALVHIFSALFGNAWGHRTHALVAYDVGIYLAVALVFTVLAALRSRWRMLCGGLLGCGLASFLLVHLKLVERSAFVLILGFAGLAVALGAMVYGRIRTSPRRNR
jgi:serine/threonine protein kinase